MHLPVRYLSVRADYRRAPRRVSRQPRSAVAELQRSRLPPPAPRLRGHPRSPSPVPAAASHIPPLLPWWSRLPPISLFPLLLRHKRSRRGAPPLIPCRLEP